MNDNSRKKYYTKINRDKNLKDEFIKAFGETFGLQELEYIPQRKWSRGSRYVIFCKKHGKQSMHPTTLYEKIRNSNKHTSPCTDCKKEETLKIRLAKKKAKNKKWRSSLMNTKKMKAKLIPMYEGRLSFEKSIYNGYKKDVEVTCINGHGSQFKKADMLLRGQGGCKYCNNGKGHFRYDKPTVLYYIKVNGYYKIGVTNKTVEERFGNETIDELEVIKCWNYSTGSKAVKVEAKILNLFSDYKYEGDKIIKHGNTELFTTDITKLDIPFPLPL